MIIKSFTRLVAALATLVLLSPLAAAQTYSAGAQPAGGTLVYLPLVLRNPAAPNLQPIDNADFNNSYDVVWDAIGGSVSYRLQEATNSAFSDAVTVYDGSGTSRSFVGRLPATYYYRVQAYVGATTSAWSNVHDARINPLFVGLSLRWDGPGYARGSSDFNADYGYHKTIQAVSLTDADTIRLNGHEWYDPNPDSFGEGNWSVYYSATTGELHSSSAPGDPDWKWGYSWFLPYSLQLANGQTWNFDGQPFSLTGPHAGYTTYGKAITYWEFVNQAEFVFFDAGTDWTQRVLPGEAILRYDAGGSRLLLYADVKRHYFYQGSLSQYTVQYIETLTSATSLPATASASDYRPPTAPAADETCSVCVTSPAPSASILGADWTASADAISRVVSP